MCLVGKPFHEQSFGVVCGNLGSNELWPVVRLGLLANLWCLLGGGGFQVCFPGIDKARNPFPKGRDLAGWIRLRPIYVEGRF